jgi:hypothetical protein
MIFSSGVGADDNANMLQEDASFQLNLIMQLDFSA